MKECLGALGNGAWEPSITPKGQRTILILCFF
jgi:hypothetical protein